METACLNGVSCSGPAEQFTAKAKKNIAGISGKYFLMLFVKVIVTVKKWWCFYGAGDNTLLIVPCVALLY